MFPIVNESESDHLSIIKHEVSVDDFRILRRLGSGDVGIVFLVEWTGHSRYFAMKRLSKQDMIKRNKVRRVKEEREILASARHPFILTLYFAFHDDEHLYYITELCAGNIYEVNRLIGPPEGQHCSALCCRSQNILIGFDGHIRLADFDLSKKAESVSTSAIVPTTTPFRSMLRIFGSQPLSQPITISSKPMMSTTSLCGTPEYLAPEVISGPFHSASVDWWALGVLLFELSAGYPPFRGQTQEVVFNAIKNGSFRFPDISLSSDLKSLIRKLLVTDPEKRLGAEHGASEVKSHRYFKKLSSICYVPHRGPLILVTCLGGSLPIWKRFF
ncbi:hypothetical protein GEMRC1_010646 [Eukaryota sp. GEM-RC1]